MDSDQDEKLQGESQILDKVDVAEGHLDYFQAVSEARKKISTAFRFKGAPNSALVVLLDRTKQVLNGILQVVHA